MTHNNCGFNRPQRSSGPRSASVLSPPECENTWRSEIKNRHTCKVKNTQGDSDLTLISDTQEIDHIGDYLGINRLSEDYGCLFVEIADGDYGHILGCESNIPYLEKILYDIDYYEETWRFFQEIAEKHSEIYCPMCGGDSAHLGTLGTLDHYRCVMCHMEFSRSQE